MTGVQTCAIPIDTKWQTRKRLGVQGQDENVCDGFFFSSRTRHTRFTSDWSSDVCSSDLAGGVELRVTEVLVNLGQVDTRLVAQRQVGAEIGRASCRERV